MSLELSDSIQWIKGVGPKKAELLSVLNVSTIRDILYLPPRKYLDRSEIKLIKDIRVNDEVTVEGKVVSVNSRRSRKGKLLCDVSVYDGSGIIVGRWFNQSWVKDRFNTGDRLFFSGKVEFYRGLYILNPDYEFLTEEETELIHTGRIIPVYPLTKDLGQRFMRRTVNYVLQDFLEKIEEPMPSDMLKKYDLISLDKALYNLHFPENKSLLSKARERLAFDELFYLQLFLTLNRQKARERKGISFEIKSNLEKKFLSALPFNLTPSQKKVLSEIEQDMSESYPMNRLLQGDVGSGKTVVAIAAMLISVSNKFNVAFMVPTEVLAYQHYYLMKKFLSFLSVPLWLLVGNMNQSEREKILKEINKKRGIILGTHALLEEDVKIPVLGLVVIDEQHRFGVNQRAKVRGEGHPDILVMSATPIPRTLALSVYGELDVSTIDEMPPGRIFSKTKWVRNPQNRARVYNWIKEKISKENCKAYIVFPLIEESESLDLRSIEEEAEYIKKTFFSDSKVAILHGRMKSREKDKIMKAFKGDEVDVLISTTVIEVGIDVPQANIMVVEDADRFGLAQLHQLRGRIGRSSNKKSYFIMIADKDSITDRATLRLDTLENISSGFKLSEVDLVLRGPGEFFGTKQHGFPDFKFFDPFAMRNMIGVVRNAVKNVIKKNSEDKFLEEIERIRGKSQFLDIA
ncbi:ATP-dependent DNA helicase RecG [candidate division WOR-3 bacterium]|nr:ATP-dependent DNA helicase RecG [candidate division WOR-3 bacterium]